MGIEIERKFLVNSEAWRSHAGKAQHFCQGYLMNSPESVVRIRIAGDKGYLTVKGKTVHSKRLEYEYEIPVTDAREMLERLCPGPLIEKERHPVVYKGEVWVIDLFHGENTGLVVAEIELNHVDQKFVIPDWIGTEVTEDPRYFNSNLILTPYSRWKEKP